MLKAKKDVAHAVTILCRKELRNIDYKKKLQNIADILEKTHNISISESIDLLSLRTDPNDVSEFLLFCIIQILDNKNLDKYFTDIEIKEFDKKKLKKERIKFPLTYDVIQITDTQWIGSITAKELMELQDAQLIKYNENTQRTLKRMTSNNVEYYKIDINRAAVNAMIDSYRNDFYIPNTITLNIPETAEFKYENQKLIFKNIDTFDILDGYHRLIAMTNLYVLDNTFDYPMEIRFVLFSEDKAKQFIWQEDQKTKMSRIDSDSFNQNNYANQVISMLDQVTALKGIINRNGIINAGYASCMINFLWFNKDKQYNRKELVSTKDLIKEKLVDLIDNIPESFESHWEHRKIMTLFYLIHKDKLDCFEKFYNYLKEVDYPAIRGFNQRDLTRLEKHYKNFIKAAK